VAPALTVSVSDFFLDDNESDLPVAPAASLSPKADGARLWKVFRRGMKRSNRPAEVELSELPLDKHALDCPLSAPPTPPEESEELHEISDSDSECGGGLWSNSDDESTSRVVRT